MLKCQPKEEKPQIPPAFPITITSPQVRSLLLLLLLLLLHRLSEQEAVLAVSLIFYIYCVCYLIHSLKSPVLFSRVGAIKEHN